MASNKSDKSKKSVRRTFKMSLQLLVVVSLFLSTPAHALEAVTLQLKWLHQFQFAGYYAAKAKGYYRDAGLDVTFTEAKPGQSGINSVLEGSAQYGIDGSNLLLARGERKPVVALCAIFQHSPGILVTKQDSPIQSIHSLIGKRIMLEEGNDEILAYFKKENLSADKYSLVKHSFNPQDLIDGKIDAMTAYATNELYYLDKAGFRYMAFTPRSAGVDFYGDILYTTEQEIGAHPARVKAFREASIQGWKYALAHPEEMADLILARYSQRKSREHLLFEAKQMMELIRPDLIEIGYMNPGRWRDIADIYADLGMLPLDVSLAGFMYDPTPKHGNTRLVLVVLMLSVCVAIAAGFLVLLKGMVKHKTKELTSANSELTEHISERIKAEESLRTSESHYRALFDNSLFGVTVVGKDSRLIEANEAFCKMLGYSKEELIGKMSFTDITHPDDVNTSIQLFNQLFNHEIDHYSLEKRYISKSEEIIYALIYVRGHFNASDGYEGLTATVLDISESKQIFKTLQNNEEKYRNLFNNAEVAMFRTKLDGSEVFDVNQKFLDMLGVTREETIGKPSQILWVDPQEREEMVRRLLADGRVSEYEYKMLTKQGEIKSCITSLILYREQGILEGSILDITKLKKAEEEKIELEQQFQHTQKLESLGVLSGGIAHDFNNILAVIMGYCALTKMDYETSEKNINEIEKAAERAAGLCRQMLAYAGKAHLIKSKVNMGMMVDEMLTMLKATIPQNAVIRADLSSDIPAMEGDASQLRQVVMNLVINASEAIGTEQGEVKVSLANIKVSSGKPYEDYHGKSIPPGEYICLEVTDTGCGMDDATKWRIFEPFYTTKFTGRGLGMSAVLGIIKSHGGYLQLFSKSGHGTTFRVYLPAPAIDTSEAQNETSPVSSAPWRGSGTILLVEDEDQVRLIAKALLEKFGFTVLEAVNGKEALELYQENATDILLVLTDMGMPVMDGYDLFHELKKLDPELPIIVSSGYGDAEVRSRIGSDNIAGLISKPYNPVQLRDVLRGVVDSFQ